MKGATLPVYFDYAVKEGRVAELSQLLCDYVSRFTELLNRQLLDPELISSDPGLLMALRLAAAVVPGWGNRIALFT
jgi:hypothetical protein